ncbi:exosortase/archaeosortase family protein [archaeon]|nr:exosortase/archaeosortase family protein [archaeon]
MVKKMKKTSLEKNRNKEKLLKFFLLKFFVIFAFLYALLYIADLRFVEEFVAKASAGLIGLQAGSSTVNANGALFIINESCTGFVSIIILAATVFSLRKPDLRGKLLVFLPAGIALFALNIFRVAGVLWVGLNAGIQAAEAVHVVSWFLMSAAIIILWYYSTKKIVKASRFNELL